MGFDEERFRLKVNLALLSVRQILDKTRNPTYAADVHHTYEDKFTVAEFVVKSAVASTIQSFAALGISANLLGILREWSRTKTVSLRFCANEECKFLREHTYDVESPEKRVTRGALASLSMCVSSKEVTTVTDYFWNFEAKYSLVAFCGVGSEPNQQHEILCRSCHHQMKTSAKRNPRHECTVHPPVVVDITWLLRNLDENLNVNFKIQRGIDTCRTPRRNEDVERALQTYRALQFWVSNVRCYFADLFSVWKDHALDMSAISAQGVFIPVLPLLDDLNDVSCRIQMLRGADSENADVMADAETQGTVGRSPANTKITLTGADFQILLREQQRCLLQKLDEMTKIFPPSESRQIISSAEARLLVCLIHVHDVGQHLTDGVNAIEEMLRRQLFAAVGKHLTSVDFSEYTKFHNRRLFRPGFDPRPFCYSVRRTVNHSPEGQLSIEERFFDRSMIEPAQTIVRYAGAGRTQDMQFSLNAATTVTFGGDRYLHAWLRSSFTTQAGPEVFLSAQARQFSSFIVLVGTISSATVFEPKYGMIVQNKDEIRIPLMLDTIPSPKEFRDAIQSLSPEQQAFAKAFRSMQLASTLFGVCVIQIKPQLERLLNLPPESLTKEIKLTQDLMELFIKYQIPSDLLSAGQTVTDDEGSPGGKDGAKRLAEVKRHVAAMHAMLEESKQEELAKQASAAAYRQLECLSSGANLLSSSSPSSSDCSNEDSTLEGCCDPYMEDEDCEEASRSDMRFKGRSPPVNQYLCESKRIRCASRSRSRGISPDGVNNSPDGERDRQGSSSPAGGADRAAATPPQKQPDTTADPGSNPGRNTTSSSGGGAGRVEPQVADYTKLPGEINRQLEALDAGGAVRPTTIRPGEEWSKRSVASLLSSGPAAEATVGAEGQRGERVRAFELLDALTRGGAVRVEEASLHVVLAATHVFDKGLVDTVVEDGVNPVDKVERSTLIMASAVLQQPVVAVVRDEHVSRLQGMHPALFKALPPGGE